MRQRSDSRLHCRSGKREGWIVHAEDPGEAFPTGVRHRDDSDGQRDRARGKSDESSGTESKRVSQGRIVALQY